MRVFIVLLLLAHFCVAKEFYVDEAERLQLKNLVKDMFYHAYDNYMLHAFPMDELRPSSCSGEDSLGGYSLTLIDALDTLVVMGNYTEFESRVWWIVTNLSFDIDKPVSVFETSIRILGGLLAAHLSATKIISGYNDELLDMAVDVGERLLPAFDTPTGIPYGTVNLRHGVPKGETTITCTASTGTFSIEFGTLSRLTGRPEFEKTAKRAVKAVWDRRSSLNLLGNHIDISSGEWTHKDSGIGSGVDSYFEYLLKAAIFFQDQDYLDIFREAYEAINNHIKKDPWYLEVQMGKGSVSWALFTSLQAYWPGIQVLFDDIEPAATTVKAFHSVWRRFGVTPEGFNLINGEVQPGQQSYPLRPELIESLYYMWRVNRDPLWSRLGRDMAHNLQNLTRVKCGHAHVVNVETHALNDHMESFFLAETCKYLYLLFDDDNFINKGNYIFSTEGHMFPVDYYSPSTHYWKYPKCKGPSYLRKISADLFEVSGVAQEADDDLSDLVDYDDLQLAQSDNGICSLDENENIDETTDAVLKDTHSP